MSVRRPNRSAPTQAPATYMEAAQPATCAVEMSIPLPLAEMAPAIEPTIVTSRPSRIQTVPKPIRIRQCQRDHGSRSSRAGMLVSIVRRCSLGTVAVATGSSTLSRRRPVCTHAIRTSKQSRGHRVCSARVLQAAPASSRLLLPGRRRARRLRQRPNAHRTICGNSPRHRTAPCDATRSLITTSTPASRSAAAHRLALSRKNGSRVPPLCPSAEILDEELLVCREPFRIKDR